MEALFSALLCLPLQGDYEPTCRPVSQATVLQWQLRPHFKAVDRRARRAAEASINKNCLVGISAAVGVYSQRQVSYTFRASRPSIVKAMTVTITAEPAYKLAVTLKEF